MPAKVRPGILADPSERIIAERTARYIASQGAGTWPDGKTVVMPMLTCAWLVVRDGVGNRPLRRIQLWLAGPNAAAGGKRVMTFVYDQDPDGWQLARIF